MHSIPMAALGGSDELHPDRAAGRLAAQPLLKAAFGGGQGGNGGNPRNSAVAEALPPAAGEVRRG